MGFYIPEACWEKILLAQKLSMKMDKFALN